MNKPQLLKGITDDEERILYARALDKAFLAERSGRAQFSDFMDPRKAGVFCTLADKERSLGAKRLLWGGFEDAERRMIGFFPDYEEPSRENFPIVCIRIAYNGKFSRELTHRDFLGSVLGLGINREKVGDILVEDESACIFVRDEVSDFICTGLERVGRTKVKTELVGTYSGQAKQGEERRITVASLRLDAVLSGAFNISRGKTSDMIRAEKAFVNWTPASGGSGSVAEGDMLTLRGIGRVRLKKIEGTTKKDRVAVVLEIFKQ